MLHPATARISTIPTADGFTHGVDHSTPVNQLNFRWLTSLRWAAVIGQTVAVIVAELGMAVELPLIPIACVIASELVLNLVATRLSRLRMGMTERELAAWVGIDMIAFSLLIYLSGGPANPFSFFYIVHVAMAALTLSARQTWSLLGASAACYAALFFWHIPLPESLRSWNLHLQGLWVAYALAASCVVYFMHRARAALTERDRQLATQRELSAQSERLTSLATLAAGAAHELASPLGTIAVVCKELELELQRGGLDSATADVALVRSQVNRCRKILARMSHAAGETPGELDDWVGIDEFLHNVVRELPDRLRIRLTASEELLQSNLRCPREGLSQAIRVLLENALDASSERIELRVSYRDAWVEICVEDHGPGMDRGVLRRAFEPFFTTKPTGKGMGLGLYLARNVALSLGGVLELRSKSGQGTTAALRLPRSRFRLDSNKGAI